MISGLDTVFDFEKFFSEHPMPKEYDNKDTHVRLLDHNYFKYTVILANHNLPPLAWTGSEWQKVEYKKHD